MLVSIIIPCYNSAATIERALDSVQSQKVRDIEIIVINDGSTDNTNEIVEYWSEENPQIDLKYKYIKNSGVSVARNTGLNLVEGDYILFLDSDDILDENLIRDFVKVSNEKKVDAYFFEMALKEHKDERNLKFKLLENKELLDYYLYQKAPIGLTTFFYKSSIIKEYNIFFSEGIKYGEDREFVWKYLSHCSKGVYLMKKYYFYLISPNSVTEKISEDRFQTLEAMERVENYLFEQGHYYYVNFKSIAFARTLLYLLKLFAEKSDKRLFSYCIENYPCEQEMNKLTNHPKKGIKLSANLFLISPMLFYRSFSIKYKLFK